MFRVICSQPEVANNAISGQDVNHIGTYKLNNNVNNTTFVWRNNALVGYRRAGGTGHVYEKATETR